MGGSLAFGLGLLALFVILLLNQAGQAERPAREGLPAALKAGPSGTSSVEIPAPESELRIPRPPPGEGLSRWNLETLPLGWDPGIAARLARFFADMDVSGLGDTKKFENLEEVREQLRAYLAGLGPEAIPTLNAVLNVEADFVHRRFLLYALGDLGPRSEEATYALRDFYEASRGQQGARSEMNHAIQAMGRLKNDTSFQAMNDYIDDPGTTPYDRDKFIQALGEHPRRQEAIPRFVEGMRDQRDINTRNHSAQALGKMRRPETLPELIAAYERETIWYVRQTLLGSIGKLGDSSVLKFLEREAQNAQPSGVRLSAAGAIRRIGTPQAKRILESLLRSERDQSIHEAIQKWLEAWPASPSGR